MVDFVALHATCLVRGWILSVLYRRLPASGLLKIIFLLVPELVAEVPVEEDTMGCSMEELIPTGSVMHPGLQVYTPRPRWSVGTTTNSTAVPLHPGLEAANFTLQDSLSSFVRDFSNTVASTSRLNAVFQV